MTNREAINIITANMCLHQAVFGHPIDEPLKTAYETAIAALEKQRWIPCSERLPEENLPVLVAVKQKDRLPKWVKEQAYSYVTDIDVYDDGDFDTHKNKVVAWRPLTEPYQEDKA